MTVVLRLNADQPDPSIIAQAAAVLRAGGLVAFPTETVYGLGANALDATAVRRIFYAKQRPAEDPLIVHLADTRDLKRVTTIDPAALAALAARFWPGPLTLILPRAANVPPEVSAGRETLAVRIPAHPVALALIEAAGTPIAAPSANRFGHTSPTRAEHVLHDLDGRIELLLDAGPTPLGVESSVLDLTVSPAALLRPGAISREQLEAVLGPLSLGNTAREPADGLASPGLLERHYAPQSELWLYRGDPQAVQRCILERCSELIARGQRVGLLLPDEDLAILRTALPTAQLISESLGSATDLAGIAWRLYAALRALDAQQPALILTRDFGEAGLGLALRDRLTRAASGRVVWVTNEDA